MQHTLTRGGYPAGTVLHHLNALSALYVYAQEMEEYDPVSALCGELSANQGRTKSKKTKSLEIDEAARLLEAARTLERAKRNGLIPIPTPSLPPSSSPGYGRPRCWASWFRTWTFSRRRSAFDPTTGAL